MKNLLIIGARGWGREVCWYFKNEPTDKDIRVKGFLDSDKHALDDYRGDFPPIISDVESYIIQPDDVFFFLILLRKKGEVLFLIYHLAQ